MRILQIVFAKLISLAVFAGGVAAAVMWFNRDYLHIAKTFFVDNIWQPWGVPVAVIVAIIAFLALLPLKRPRRKSTISFPGTHGDVTIQLDSVEATLSRVVGKMPEVKKINVRVAPSEDNRRAQVTADVWMYKTSGPAGAREIANRISDYLADTAVNILGVEDITNINLNVRGVIVDGSKQITPEPAQEPKPAPTPAPAPAAAPAPTPGPSMPSSPAERGVEPEPTAPERDSTSPIILGTGSPEEKLADPLPPLSYESMMEPEERKETDTL